MQISAGATDSQAKILYLTNMQAQLFKAETVPKLMDVFEVKQASLVLNLMEGVGYQVMYDVCVEPAELSEQERAEWMLDLTHNTLGSSESFASRTEAAQATRRLSSFFKEVLLPLAADTNAIILCSAKKSEILSATLTECLPLFAAKHNGKLPFTVFGIAPAVNFGHSTLINRDSLAAEMAAKSKNWQKGLTKIEAACQNQQNEESSKWWRDDVQPGLGNYIFVECVSGKSSDRWQKEYSPLVDLQNEFFQALASQLPTLCVRTGGSNSAQPLTANVHLACRDIPVLMLDVQSRAPLDATVSSSDRQTSSRDALITKAIEANTLHHEELWALGKTQSFDQHDLAYFFDVLNCDGNSATCATISVAAPGYTQTLYHSLKTAELMAMGDAPVAFTTSQLERVINHLVEMMAQSHFRNLPATTQAELQEQKEDFTPMEHFASKMEIIWGVYYDIFKSRRIYGANLENLDAVKTLIDQIVKRDRLPSNNSLEVQQSLRDAWNTIDECVSSAGYYKRMAKVTYITCLVLGTLVIFLTLFKTHIDGSATKTLAEQSADTGMCSLVVVDAADHRFAASTGIFVTATLLTLVTGMNTFYDPSRRWRELRAIAESMQSDIFAFRTRTGVYNVDRAEPRKPEQRFVQRVQDSRVAVVQLAGLTESSFMRMYKDKVYIHGQNKTSCTDAFDIRKLSQDAPIDIEDACAKGRIIDNHHSPMYDPQLHMIV